MEKGVFLGLDGRAALVTGAGSPVGRAVAFWLARAGCDVAIVDRSKAAAERVAEELRELDFTAIAVGADVRSERRVEAMVAAVLEKFDALEVAVNCPATPPGRSVRAAAREGERSDFDEAVMASCCRAEARAMVAAGEGGALINVAWSASDERLSGDGGSIDRGLDGLTLRLAAELGRGGVRVNAILAILGSGRSADGIVAAERPSRRRQAASLEAVIPAEDLGRVAVFLASDLSRKVTGQVFRVEARGRAPGDPSGATESVPEAAAGSRRG